MMEKSITNRFSTSYADSLGIPPEIAVPILRQFDVWVGHSGIEWAISRVKDIKTDFIRMKAGLSPVTPWVKTSRKSHFGGPIGSLERWSQLNFKRWSRSIVMLQHYTRFYARDVTDKQRKKFVDGVTAKNIPIPEYITNMCLEGVSKLGKRPDKIGENLPFVLRPSSPVKREPHPNGRSFPEGEQTLDCGVCYLFRTDLGKNLVRTHTSIFRNTLHTVRYVEKHVIRPEFFPDSVGRIGLIQEAGFKLRAVANPGRIYQEALQPLGDSLYNFLKILPWDCTHNQDRPISAIQLHLSQDQVAYCTDLSGATDYFPLDLQMSVLRKLFPDSDHVNLFETLSRAPWRFEDGFIQWTKGQPLGLYPSFASFAFTHGLLLFALNGFCHDDKFFILGDDVIILDTALNVKYLKALKDLECPISESKSISSSHLAEFAGRVITSKAVFSQLKWRNPSDDSFLDVVRNIGPSAISLLRPRQRKIAKLLSEVPDFMGGLGFNPNGIPLELRIAKAYEILGSKDDASYLTSFNRKISKLLYPEGRASKDDHTVFLCDHPDLDKRPAELVQLIIPSLLRFYDIAGKNLYSISDSLNLQIDSRPSRLTTLERYENLTL